MKGRCVAPPTFPVAPLGFEYLALPQVYTFFRWRLYDSSLITDSPRSNQSIFTFPALWLMGIGNHILSAINS